MIATYNNESLLAETIESALASTGVDLEVIVVDDGSTDGTATLMQRYRDRVRYVRQANGGVGAARNRAHSEASGEYIAWLDSDDIADPDRFRLQVEILQSCPDVGLLSTDFSAFDENGTIAGSYAARYYPVIEHRGLRSLYPCAKVVSGITSAGSFEAPFYWGRVYPEIAYTNFVHPPTVMMRRDVWRHAGPLDSRFSPGTEWEFFARASRQCKFGYLDLPLLRYRRWRNQITADDNVRQNVPREMNALEAILSADPALRAETGRIRSLYRHWNMSLASATVGDDRWRALLHLMRSLRYGIEPKGFFVAAVRVAAPAALMPALGRTRRLLRRFSGQ